MRSNNSQSIMINPSRSEAHLALPNVIERALVEPCVTLWMLSSEHVHRIASNFGQIEAFILELHLQQPVSSKENELESAPFDA